jgi:hypothetical protein
VPTPWATASAKPEMTVGRPTWPFWLAPSCKSCLGVVRGVLFWGGPLPQTPTFGGCRRRRRHTPARTGLIGAQKAYIQLA